MNSVRINPEFEQLYAILMEEISAYDYLAEALKEKQQAIVNNQLDKIESLTGTEQLIIKKTNVLTAARFGLLQGIFLNHGLNTFPVTMQNFILRIAGEDEAPWERLNRRLNSIVERIQRINAENRELLRASISFVHQMIQLLYPVDSQTVNLYNRYGMTSQAAVAKSMVNCNI
jgi:flagellar biosynthesis/type III secretory pathway chaperone